MKHIVKLAHSSFNIVIAIDDDKNIIIIILFVYMMIIVFNLFVRDINHQALFNAGFLYFTHLI